MDVFVAYSSKDESRVRTIVEWLRCNGIEVWVAYELPAGVDWDTQIDEVLSEIPCVLTIWSQDSIASAEVKGEARAAMARDALVTVSLDKVLPPRSFTHLHAVDLTGLSVAEDSPRTAQALEGIRSKLGSTDSVRAGPVVEEPQVSARSVAGGGKRLWMGAGGAALVAIAAIVMLTGQGMATSSCEDEGAYILAGQTFASDTEIREDLVCIAANAGIKVKNGVRLDIEAKTLVVEGAARFDGRGEPGVRGKAGSDGPVHRHVPPKFLEIAICGKAPSSRDYSGKNGGRGGNGRPGAAIRIAYRQLEGDPALLKHDVSGGAGGAGGPGGQAGRAICSAGKPYDVRGARGRKGPSGKTGRAGSFELVLIDG